MKQLLAPAVRSWIYGIVTAIIPILSAYGVISEQEAPLWVALAAAFLATGTALAYRPTRPLPPLPETGSGYEPRHERSSLENDGQVY
ncbi:phage holin [Mobiluncus porci]|uniref:phage holin n=1 Tax=Mobiluncus porci TaxID=2652278 RepID=UPI001E33CC5D|nr:hypothetical protein [Mobiluncus porci]